MNYNLEPLDSAIAANDKISTASLSDELVRALYHQPSSFTIAMMEKMMKDLRAKRMFQTMIKIGDACMQTGIVSLKVRRQYAQALIEEKILTAAIKVLEEIINETETTADTASLFERSEALGLAGRVYKQLYVVANSPDNLSAAGYIQKAFDAYDKVYQWDPGKYLWHGINAVAMAARAKADGISLSVTVDTSTMANEILYDVIDLEANENAGPFDYATGLEACVALEKPTEAMEWLNKYIQLQEADAFEIASTLRQLTEVWRLDKNNGSMQQIIPILRGALLKKEGGTVTIGAAEIREGVFDKDEASLQAEKVFGSESYQSYEWYMKGAQRCLMVARIGREKSKGLGTGFLVKGSDLHPDLKDEIVLLTNAHVITNDPEEREALRPEEALILFEVLGLEKTYTVHDLFFTSPFKEFDVTILRFSQQDQQEIRKTLKAKGVELFTFSNRKLQKDGSERIYIIGHPAGGTLQLSLQDNALLDFEGRLLHYRTPTVGGSSGSPVFDADWNLVGIHHAGGNFIRKLNHQKGMYQANEGIRMNYIVDALKEKNHSKMEE